MAVAPAMSNVWHRSWAASREEARRACVEQGEVFDRGVSVQPEQSVSDHTSQQPAHVLSHRQQIDWSGTMSEQAAGPIAAPEVKPDSMIITETACCCLQCRQRQLLPFSDIWKEDAFMDFAM